MGSLTLVKPSILPVGLPCASCVWNTSLGRRSVGGGGSPAPFTADFPACSVCLSLSLGVSRDAGAVGGTGAVPGDGPPAPVHLCSATAGPER
uniref:Uncharacterized protein n=1 Tax=Cynoglossus semilaevis TaxID=244447 RepID=A0A3P8X3F5_CYNSE